MRKEEINGHTFEFYDSIEDLPISQFHKYSKYILVDAGVGGDISSIDNRIGKILQLIGVDDKKAYQEVLNLRQSIYMVMNEADTRNKGFLCMVCKVDGKRWDDFSDSGIDELYMMVQSAETKELVKVFAEIKGRIDDELETYFPDLFSDVSSKNIEAIAEKRAMLQLDSIINDADHEEEIARLTKSMGGFYKPKSFEEGDENAEVMYDKQFEAMCLAMSKEFGGMVKGYSVMEFYSAYESLERQRKEFEKIKNRRK